MAGETLGHSLRMVILNPGMGKRPERSALQHSSQHRQWSEPSVGCKTSMRAGKTGLREKKWLSGRQCWSGDLSGIQQGGRDAASQTSQREHSEAQLLIYAGDAAACGELWSAPQASLLRCA